MVALLGGSKDRIDRRSKAEDRPPCGIGYDVRTARSIDSVEEQ